MGLPEALKWLIPAGIRRPIRTWLGNVTGATRRRETIERMEKRLVALQEHCCRLERLQRLHYANLISGYHLVEVHGRRMLLNPRDLVITRQIVETGIWEEAEVELLHREIKPGDVVLDVGANIGYFTLLFAQWVGKAGKVIAFEPAPDNLELLGRNLDINGCDNVVVVPKAVGDRAGKARLYLSPYNTGDHRTFAGADERLFVEVEIVRIDDCLSGLTDRVDFIKIDIQGSEYLALRGAEETLRRNPELRILTEFWPSAMSQIGQEPEDYVRFLRSCSFELYRWDEGTRTPMPINIDGAVAECISSPMGYINLFCRRAA